MQGLHQIVGITGKWQYWWVSKEIGICGARYDVAGWALWSTRSVGMAWNFWGYKGQWQPGTSELQWFL